MKQRTLAYVLLLSILISLFAGCTEAIVEEDMPQLSAGDPTAYSDGNWDLTKEWTVTREDSGAETLTVSAVEDSTAWNTFFKLYEDWTVSANMQLLGTYGETDCTRIVFGDSFNNILLVFSAEHYNGTVLLKSDVLTDNGWKNIYEADEWIAYDVSSPLSLKVERNDGEKKLLVSLSQNDNVLVEGKTKTVVEDVLTAIRRPGFSVYHSSAAFTSLAVQAAKPSNKNNQPVEGLFETGEHIPNEDWVFDENSVHNLIGDKSAIVVDGQGECIAWNAVTDLSVPQWTLSMNVEFGKSYRDSVCARYAFGPMADPEGDVVGLFTTNYINGTVDFAAQVKDNGSWITVGTSMGWIPVSARSIRIQFVKYEGINRIAVFIFDKDMCIFNTFTDEMEEYQIEAFKRFGCMVYSSQVRFTDFVFEETADESIMPPQTEKVYPSISNLEVPESGSSAGWILSRNAICFNEDGASGLYINSKGEEFSYYTAKSIRGTWSFSANVDFGKYYSDTAGIRISFKNADNQFAALLTVKYSPGGSNIDANMQTYVSETDDWNDVIKSGWKMGGPSFRLELSGDETGTFNIRILNRDGSKVIYEGSTVLEEAVLKNMQVIGLSPLTSEVKYSAMQMELSGPAISLNVSSGGGGGKKPMIPISVGNAVSTDQWSMEDGVSYHSDGSLLISTGKNAYSYREGVQIVDGFTISTDIHFGNLDSSGCCTPRIVLVDGSRNMLALFTIKYSENAEILVEGEYNFSGNWTKCFGDGKWRAVQDNRIHVTISRQPGSNVVSLYISDYSGKSIYSVSVDMPAAVARQIAGFGLGVDNSSAKFSNMNYTLSGRETASDDMGDYGLHSLVVGTPTTTDLWTSGEGITYNTNDELIIQTDSNAYSYRNNFNIVDGFSIETDILFSGLDGSGCSTPRIAFVDSGNNMVSLITVKFSINNCDILVDGEYNYSGNWHHNLGDGQWRKVQDNRIHLSVTRAPGSNTCELLICDFSGAEIFRQSYEMPPAVARQITGFGFGADNSDAKFYNIKCSLSGRDTPSNDIEDYGLVGIQPGNPTATSDWILEEGASYLDNGTLLIEGNSAFAKDANTTISNGFRITGNILYASLDDSNCSTARVAFLNNKGDKISIITFKFSLNLDMMVSGEYDAGGGWVACVNDTSWHVLKDNRIHFVLERKDNDTKVKISVMDYDGNTIFTETCNMPYSVASSITGYAVGVDNSKVQFSEIYAEASDSKMEEQQMQPITETGSNVGSSSVWTSASGTSFYSDGSVIMESAGADTFTYRTDLSISDAFSFRATLQFGTLSANGTSTARIVLTDASNSTVALFTLMFDKGMKAMAMGQYMQDGSWVTCLPDTGWQLVSGNTVYIELTRVAGSRIIMLQVKDDVGSAAITAFTTAIPDDTHAAISNLGVGCFDTRVKWSDVNITTGGSQGGVTEDGEEQIVVDSSTTSPYWTSGNGVIHTTDDRIVTAGNGDVYSYNTAYTFGDSYSVTTDIVFGEKAADGTCTARVVLADAEQSPVGLFTFKYDKEKKLRIEGQHYFGGSWTTLMTQEWALIGTNHIVVTVSKAADSKKWTLTVTKADGTYIYSGSTAELSDELLAAVVGCGLGSNSSQVQFSNIYISAE